MNKLLLLFSNWLASAFSGNDRLIILIFHRVLPEYDPLDPSEVTKTEFEEKISYLAKNYNILPLENALELLYQKKLPRKAISITFDDGYADNFSTALPILQAHNAKATFFITTNYLDGGIMWNDAIREAVRQWNLPTMDIPDTNATFNMPKIVNERGPLAEEIIKYCKYLKPDIRKLTVDWMIETAELDKQNKIMLTSDELRSLHQAGMSIGGHTKSHPILCNISKEEAQSEIREGIAILEKKIGQSIKGFAYPNGKPDSDYSSEHVEILVQAGISFAVSTEKAVTRPTADPRQLPRFTPWQKDKPRFFVRLALAYRNII